MCNELHDDSEPIKSYGFGWKMFQFFYDGEKYYKLCAAYKKTGYKKSICGWINWYNNSSLTLWIEDALFITDPLLKSTGYFADLLYPAGFCLFKYEKDTFNICRLRNRNVIFDTDYHFHNNQRKIWKNLYGFYKVQYAGGLGEHYEPSLNKEILLVKSFRIIGKPKFPGTHCKLNKLIL